MCNLAILVAILDSAHEHELVPFRFVAQLSIP